MSLVRDVLSGAQPVDFGRHTRDEYHWLSNRRHEGGATEDELHAGFAALILDPDPRLRSAAVCWFANHQVRGVGPILVVAFLSEQALYDGQPQGWLPGDRDQGDWLRIAIAKNALDVPGGLQIAQDAALRPGRGQDVFVSLLHAEPRWVRANLARIATRSPAVIDILFFHLGLLDVDPADVAAELAADAPEAGAALLAALEARELDISPAVLGLVQHIDVERLRGWIEAAVQDPVRRAAALELLE